MNAIDILKSQHREVEKLFKQFEEASDISLREEIAGTICDKLAVHATLEEQHFYPAAHAQKTHTLLLESLEEHLAAKRVIADLLDLDPEDETFAAKVKVLKDEIQHHVKEEESELFPRVSRILSSEQLEDLGRVMTATESELQEGPSPREAVREETDQAPSLI